MLRAYSLVQTTLLKGGLIGKLCYILLSIQAVSLPTRKYKYNDLDILLKFQDPLAPPYAEYPDCALALNNTLRN